jgi:hypothetical protein
MSVYLGPDRPRWVPSSEDEIRQVLRQGLFAETHYVDGKREVGSNKELGRDLASFAIDGGALLFGIEENKQDRTWSPRPQPLEGLAERVDQIAGQLVEPPLYVVCREIAAATPAVGYLHVEIPPSARAPHMVDGIYYGRGDTNRIRLSDAEVIRHHERRESVEALAHRLLDQEEARDPVEPVARTTGHLYAVAQPLTARRDVALQLVRGQQSDVRQLVDSVERHLPATVQGFAPDPGYANSYARRAHGLAFVSQAMTGAGRTFVPGEHDRGEDRILDIEFREDGGIRLLMGRMTDQWKTEHIVADGLAVGYALRLARWAASVGERVGYRGAWVLGLHANGLRGLPSSVMNEHAFGRHSSTLYDAETYREVTAATHLESLQQPWAVADRLAGRLVRGFGTEHRYDIAFRDPAAAT